MRSEICNLKALVQTVMQFYHDDPACHSLKIYLGIDPGLANFYRIEESKAAQIALNLLEHVMQVTVNGQIEINLARICREQNIRGCLEDEIQVTIVDSSSSLNGGQLRSIFEPIDYNNMVELLKNSKAASGFELMQKNMEHLGAGLMVTPLPSGGREYCLRFHAEVVPFDPQFSEQHSSESEFMD